MKPYYSEDGITIYHGDCREVLPTLPQVDLVLTDPPYGLNYNNGDLAHNWESAFGGATVSRSIARPIAGDGEEQALGLLEATLTVVKVKLLKGGCCCCCCCCGGGGPKPLFAKWTLMMDRIIGFKQAVVWDKGGLGMGIHFRRSYEFMLVAQNGDPCRVWNGGNTTSNVWRVPKIIPQDYEHPTEKPEQFMRIAVALFTHEGGIVLDPFMGSGTTLRAAKDLGRKAIGIEIEEKYCEIAAKRLAQKVLDFK